MTKRFGLLLISLLITPFFLVLPERGLAGSLPESTQKILKKLKVDSSILDGLDKELKVPQGWIDKAKKEGKVKVRDTACGSCLCR